MAVKIVQKIWDKMRGKDKFPSLGNPASTHYGDKFIYQGDAGARIVYETLQRPAPCLVARFGGTELRVLSWFMYHMNENNVVYTERIHRSIANLSGFFNPEDIHLTRFSCEMLEIARDIDVLGVWFRFNEKEICNNYLGNDAKLVGLACIGDSVPLSSLPWTRYLAGKRVLVIHPFVETIERQYQKRELLFSNPDVLPKFDLITLKAYQSLSGNNPEGFTTWFEALESMKQRISNTDFDVALVAAGAYGLFLAHHCKMLGKKCVHVGGAMQLLFGIKGKRWDSLDARLYNEHWVRPEEIETPAGFEKVEGGCYW